MRSLFGVAKRRGVKHAARDPICGMDVDAKTARYKTKHLGKTYYFCSAGCKANFKKNMRTSEKQTRIQRSKPHKSYRRRCH